MRNTLLAVFMFSLCIGGLRGAGPSSGAHQGVQENPGPVSVNLKNLRSELLEEIRGQTLELEKQGFMTLAFRGLSAMVRLAAEEGSHALHSRVLRAQAHALVRINMSGYSLDVSSPHSLAQGLPPQAFTDFELGALNYLLASARAVRAADPLTQKEQEDLAHTVTLTACRKAYQKRNSGDPIVAREIFQQAIRAVGHLGSHSLSAQAHLHNDLCNLRRGLGEYKQALADCEAALRFGFLSNGTVEEPSMNLFRFNLGYVLKDMKNTGEAIEIWRSIAPVMQDVDTWTALGLACLTSGQTWDAFEMFRNGHYTYPSHPFPFVGAATIFMRTGQWKRAVQMLRPIQQPKGVPGHYHELTRVNTALVSLPFESVTESMAQPAVESIAGDKGKEASISNCAVVYLTSDSQEDLKDLFQSLRLLHQNFQVVHGNYRVIIFYDRLTDEQKEFVRSSGVEQLQFALVNLEVPDDTSRRFNSKILKRYLGYGIGYRGMCRFFSGPIFHHEAMRDVEIYMRLDVDSFILEKMPFDPFRELVERKASYAYLATGKEEEPFAVNLGSNFTSIASTLGINLRIMDNFSPSLDWDLSFYYTNFEVSRLDFWRSAVYSQIFDYLDSTGGFFLHRWGDGPVHLLAVAYLLQPEQVLRWDRVPYWHQSLVVLP